MLPPDALENQVYINLGGHRFIFDEKPLLEPNVVIVSIKTSHFMFIYDILKYFLFERIIEYFFVDHAKFAVELIPSDVVPVLVRMGFSGFMLGPWGRKTEHRYKKHNANKAALNVERQY